MIELSKLEPVELRKVWKHEANEFTPWLKKNIEQLGAVLGLDLEARESEAQVGTFSLDILAHDLTSNRPVVIENQLEGTDHDHLGKLLTYAAGFDPNVVVWIAREFRPEHRAAIDWLNHRTGEDTAFFAITIEAWRIADSPTAPKFNLVASPNDWERQKAQESGGESHLSPRQKRYKDFFQDLVDALRETPQFTTGATKGQPQSWMRFGSGSSGVPFGTFFDRDGFAGVSVTFDHVDGSVNDRRYDALEKRREAIEDALGYPLVWDRMEHAKSCTVSVRNPGSIDADDRELVETREWMIDTLVDFKQVLSPHLKDILT